MDADVIRGVGSALTVGGSILLAFRVTGILKALGEVAKMHEHNILEISKPSGDIFIATNSINWIVRAQKLWLLWLGFGLSIVGGLLQFASAFFVS